MLKCESLPRTNWTKSETQNIFVKFQQNEHTPGHIHDAHTKGTQHKYKSMLKLHYSMQSWGIFC